MALRKVQSASIADNAITSAKIASDAVTTAKIASGAVTAADLNADVNSVINNVTVNTVFTGAAIKVPTGTTAERPASSAVGMIRYNTTTAVLEQYTTDGWVGIEPAPTISSITLPNSQTAVYDNDVITINGSGFKNGAIVKFQNGATIVTSPVVTRVSSSIMNASINSGLSEGTYTVIVNNPSGLGTTFDNAFSVDGTPIFVSTAGSLGSLLDYVTTANYNCGATEDGANITSYQLVSGVLPNGLSFNTTTGYVTGTPNTGVSADTTYSFTIKATDIENQTNTRSFSITILENYQASGSAYFG